MNEREVRGLPTAVGGLITALFLVAFFGLAFFIAQNDNWQPAPTATLPLPTLDTLAENGAGTAVPTGESSTLILTATPSPTSASSASSQNETPTVTATPYFTVTLTAAEIASRAEIGDQCPAPPDNWQPYTVQTGDTVSSLALGSGATVAEVTQVNCITMSSIYTGKTVYLPTTPPLRTICGPPAGWSPYTVQGGDTLYSLASKRGTTIYQILQANCLVGVSITVGGSLYLPAPLVTATPIPTDTPVPPPTNTPAPPHHRSNCDRNSDASTNQYPYPHGRAEQHPQQHADNRPHTHTNPHRNSNRHTRTGRYSYTTSLRHPNPRTGRYSHTTSLRHPNSRTG